MLFLFNYCILWETIRCVYFGRFVEHFYAYVIEIGALMSIWTLYLCIYLCNSFVLFVLYLFFCWLVLNWSQVKIGKSIAFAKWDYIYIFTLYILYCLFVAHRIKMDWKYGVHAQYDFSIFDKLHTCFGWCALFHLCIVFDSN